ncbi:MAG: hypothetical protein A2017_13825 [Lentisphaerae bacterium GWF2_44_16]|nr:MAG: hypothetical protein A2017_13825 [Lentisphaerae bacterium GWF2_44_16]
MIKKLILRDFRNYQNIDISFDSNLNVFFGKNGQGKTNILEAIFFSGMLRSFRTSQIRDIKKIGSNGFYIGLEISNKDSWTKFIEIEYISSRKLKIDGNSVFKASDFIKQIKTVVFSPDDINIILGNAGLRRRFTDMLISVQSTEYLIALNNYMVALQSRNAVLKSHIPDSKILKAYETILSKNIFLIIELRKKYLAALTEKIREILNGFYGEDYTFDIKYRTQFSANDEASYLKHFETERKKDMERGFTGFGPQLDEVEFIYNGKLMKNFASTGQCRLISLCLKMAEINMLAENSPDKNGIIVLVDDVTGELDATTKKTFTKIINKAEQAFFTFTEPPSDDSFKTASFFSVSNGVIEKINKSF